MTPRQFFCAIVYSTLLLGAMYDELRLMFATVNDEPIRASVACARSA
jgi:hypothetical protein